MRNVSKYYMMGGRHNRRTIGRLTSCGIEIMAQRTPEIMAFMSCITGSSGHFLFIECRKSLFKIVYLDLKKFDEF